MEEAGVEFRCGVNVGVDISAEEIQKTFDRVVLCCGASNPRDITAEGRDAKGIYFAVDFLKEVSKKLMDFGYDYDAVIKAKNYSFGSLKGKKVVVIGGGDTGNDCVGTCIRLGAKSVVQLEMMPPAPPCRAQSNPWPEWPRVLKTDYGQEEAIYKFGKDPRIFSTTVTEFLKDASGALCGVKTVELERKTDAKTGRVSMVPKSGTEKEIKAELVLIAAGFLGCESYVTDQFGVARDQRTNVATSTKDVASVTSGMYQTSKENIFAAGDMRRGQSLVVWAIAEGRGVAGAVDESLMGYTNS